MGIPGPSAPKPWLLRRRLLHAVEPRLARGNQTKPKKSRFRFEAAYRGVHVKVIRRSEQTNLNVSRANVPRELYFFYEKNTGVSHFHVEAGPDGQFPVEQAAGLLAMHCLVRGQSPRDYVVMVQAAPDALYGLTEKAEQLLQAGHSVGSSVKLTRREEEVLGGVMRSLANKEIAASLNLSERTVKFHVSSLLAKFRVRGRMELVREAARHTAAPMTHAEPVTARETRSSIPPPHTYSQVARNIGPIALTKRQLLA
jgi:DNA-binding CsgD family transcriptional regulator